MSAGNDDSDGLDVMAAIKASQAAVKSQAAKSPGEQAKTAIPTIDPTIPARTTRAGNPAIPSTAAPTAAVAATAATTAVPSSTSLLATPAATTAVSARVPAARHVPQVAAAAATAMVSTSPSAAPQAGVERRYDYDGKPYTLPEFVGCYGGTIEKPPPAWLNASRVPWPWAQQQQPPLQPQPFQPYQQQPPAGAGGAQGFMGGMQQMQQMQQMHMQFAWQAQQQQLMAQRAMMLAGQSGAPGGALARPESPDGATTPPFKKKRKRKEKIQLGPGSFRKCWLCVAHGESDGDRNRLQMKWSDELGELDWADGHADNSCPSLPGGRATAEQAAAAKKAWSMARSKRSPYHRYVSTHHTAT